MVEWRISEGLTPYLEAEAAMQARVAAIVEGRAPELIWLLEHPALYTAGTSAKPDDLHDPDRFPVFKTGRGGQYTYHGPGQRVVYVMLDLNKRGRDIRHYVSALEAWILATLSDFGISGRTHADRVGVWVPRPERAGPVPGVAAEDKIAAIGVKIRKWVSFHGIAINHDPDLSHFEGITPCGIRDFGVTSLVDLGLPISMNDLDLGLQRHFGTTFRIAPHLDR